MRYLKNTWSGLCCLLMLFACQTEDIPETDKSLNEWIESTMRENYLWYKEIPEKGKLNFNMEPEPFFTSMLSLKDGKKNSDGMHYYYSYIKETTGSTKSYHDEKPSFGFEYKTWRSGAIYSISVLYTLPNSPATQAGLKRGDWIVAINNEKVNSSNYMNLSDLSSAKLGLSDRIGGDVKRTISLTATQITDNPVYLEKVFDTAPFSNKPAGFRDRKIGYLMYNHFTSGPAGDNDETFNNSMRSAFARFKAAGVEDFILDLRYNLGGLVTSAQLLATMLAPESALNQEFCHLTYNDKYPSAKTIALDTKYMGQGTGGANLNLKRLFILISDRTASASEAVINGLRPYLGNNLILLGTQTEGKNVGSVTYENSKCKYILQPIICQIFNKDNQSDYVDGFMPNIPLTKEEGDNMGELGSLSEYFLNKTLTYILWGETTVRTDLRMTNNDRTLIYCSLDNRKAKGSIITENR
ncbi:MAG: S41 family peptidase [Tannerellaceae bacterium]